MFYLQFAQVLKTAFRTNTYGSNESSRSPSTKKNVENLIDKNLAEEIEYQRVDSSMAWLEFLDKTALA